jgi:DNA-binding MarR family transcriptional regulator
VASKAETLGDEAELDLTGLSGKIGYLLRRAQITVFAEFTDALRELRLRPGQFAVLRLIGSNPGLSQAKVSATLGIQRANLVAVIDELEARRMLNRDASTTDRRSHCLHLTAEGRRVLIRSSELQDRHEAIIGRRLGAGGYTELLRLLSKLV